MVTMVMRFFPCLYLLCALGSVSSLLSDESLAKTCVACHGKKGEGSETLKAPALAGQKKGYLLRQLIHFKSGVRGAHPKDSQGAQMRAMSIALTPEKMKEIASYYSKMESPEPKKHEQKSNLNGEVTFGVCQSCHGMEAEGIKFIGAPNLTILGGDYLLRQLMNYKSGLRGYDKSDSHGIKMVEVVQSLEDRDLVDVTAYILSLEK